MWCIFIYPGVLGITLILHSLMNNSPDSYVLLSLLSVEFRHSLNTSENPQFKTTNLLQKKILQILVKIWAVSLWVWIYYTFIFLLTTATKCIITCHHELAIKMKPWSSREYSNIETNEFLLLCKTEFNFQANDCYNITAYFRSWNRCAAMRNKWTLWLVFGSGGCQDNGNREWSTALHSTAEQSTQWR